MRSLLSLCLLASVALLAAAAPNANVCPMERVQLELRPLDMGRDFGTFQLAFVAVDPHAASDKADFIDIHYRSASRASAAASDACIGVSQRAGLSDSSAHRVHLLCLFVCCVYCFSLSLFPSFSQHQQRGQREPSRSD